MKKIIFSLITLFCCLAATAQSITVKSHVVDAQTGEDLPYVSIYASQDNGTLTNYEGDFTIEVDSTAVLRLSCVGYQETQIKAIEAKKTIKMTPLTHSMREVQVRAWPNTVLQVAKKLNKEYESKKGKKSQYFMRMTTTLRTRDLVEAFVEANSASNLRDITILKGINGRLTQKGLSEPAIASMNFHHPLELGPLTRGVAFWSNLMTPLNASGDNMIRNIVMLTPNATQKDIEMFESYVWGKESKLQGIIDNYEVTGEELIDENKKLIYRIQLKENPKNTSKRAIMTGTLYVDAKTMLPLRFDGKVENMKIQARKDMQIVSAPIDLDLHINYRHDKKFTEISDIAIKMKSGDFSNQTLLYNVNDLKLKMKGKKQNRAKEDMLKSVREAGFDVDLWKQANVVQRTKDEERLAGLENQSELVADTIAQPTTKMGKLIDRLTRFSQRIPQEKVYLHMDNTSYFLGDTIWFAAYTRQTNNDKPSNISHVLYVELYNQDGYMMERKLVEMRDGRGHGSFALSKEYYGGFYELRAYTRWQLNWGLKEHWHSAVSKGWYLNKEQEMLHYRDYEKLYSRVFPVYDAPKKEGQYDENMTTRPMRRYFKNDPDKPSLEMTLFPEGGDLVEGLPCRVAYEVLWEDGEEPGEGILNLGDETGKQDAKDAKQQAKSRKKQSSKELRNATKKGKTAAQNSTTQALAMSDTIHWQKHRGTFTITPTKDMERTIRFIDRQGNEAKAKLPKPEKEGVALQVDQTDTTWIFNMAFTTGMQRDSLGITIMNEGNVLKVLTMDSLMADTLRACLTMPKKDLREGVNQVTIFDVDGRIWADRLFYNTLPDHATAQSKSDVAITFLGTNEDDSIPSASAAIQDIPVNALSFGPYQHIRLGVQSMPNSVISMSVRDAAYNDQLYDNATMRTEMLLASEVRGFIPNPQWYFEKDDQEHRDALDLLLMIQGWRRFNWREMAVPNTWEITQSAEATPTISGRVYNSSSWEYHDFIPEDYATMSRLNGIYNVNNPTTLAYANLSQDQDSDSDEDDIYKIFDHLYDKTNVNEDITKDYAPEEEETVEEVYNEVNAEQERQNDMKKKRKKDVVLHAELVSIDGKETRATEQFTKNGRFRFLLPGYYGEAVLFISAADTMKWWSKDMKKKKEDYPWIQTIVSDEELPEGHKRKFRVEPADYKVIVDFPYPRFVKPYNYYQQRLLETTDKLLGTALLADGTHQMREVKVGAKHGGMKRFSDSIPALIIDAEQAWNDAIDGGIYYPSPEMIVSNYLGDYGLDNPYKSVPVPNVKKPILSRDIVLRFGYDITRRATHNITTAEDSIYMRGNLASIRPYDHLGQLVVNMTPVEIAKYYDRASIDKYIIYTDYQPRLEGSNRYYGSNLPETHIAIYPFADDAKRHVYRDRHYILKGFAFHDDFYHPNYKNRKLEEKPKDYRRTLYWNPELKLDNDGKAEVKLYNNGKHGQISVSAEGLAKDGTILGN
ncbi:MAG: carboxypeptidase-like regulatory domain-containing protein [Bacteroidaceae bacterium]|nr:carboxypeptidase-like regulatory domain-containing protein [Bacteroidaceae bacterium]